jgi:hopene-associated glycosyltransferase HpnB
MSISIIIFLSLVIWIYLIFFRGQFWLSNQYLSERKSESSKNPKVSVIIPARNEAEVLPISLNSVLNQDYKGKFSLILIDDQSTDNTGKIAEQIAKETHRDKQLTVLNGQPLPGGWTGKLWAMQQGVNYALENLETEYFLLTDADIKHDSNNLRQLIAKAEKDNLDLVSLMVRLRCESLGEKLLIPAFVFFFQKLYPFPWVNHPKKKTAAAAGGCILIRAEALQRIGGLQALRDALIDDCTLAALVKKTLPENRSIWLGLSNTTYSLRAYPHLTTIWNMVARTAFTQLNYSVWLLVGTIIGMILTYLVAPIGLLVGIVMGNGLVIIASGLTWLLMAIAYYPTLKLYQFSPLWGLSLPAIAFFYSLMTIDSAWRYWRGEGGKWKGRVYPSVDS